MDWEEAKDKIHNVPVETLRKWKNSCISKRKIGSGRPIKYKDFDDHLYKMIVDRRSKKLKVSTKYLVIYAKSQAQNFEVQLKFSNGWLEKFKARHKLRIRRKTKKTLNISLNVNQIIKDFKIKFLKTVRHYS